jgi:hypothetical protein
VTTPRLLVASLCFLSSPVLAQDYSSRVDQEARSGDHHTPTYLADDSAIPVGVKAMSVVILDYLSRHK